MVFNALSVITILPQGKRLLFINIVRIIRKNGYGLLIKIEKRV